MKEGIPLLKVTHPEALEELHAAKEILLATFEPVEDCKIIQRIQDGIEHIYLETSTELKPSVRNYDELKAELWIPTSNDQPHKASEITLTQNRAPEDHNEDDLTKNYSKVEERYVLAVHNSSAKEVNGIMNSSTILTSELAVYDRNFGARNKTKTEQTRTVYVRTPQDIKAHFAKAFAAISSR